ncbi:hypothetical protein MRX96_026354 [Rhipicephalus microplus]
MDPGWQRRHKRSLEPVVKLQTGIMDEDGRGKNQTRLAQEPTYHAIRAERNEQHTGAYTTTKYHRSHIGNKLP